MLVKLDKKKGESPGKNEAEKQESYILAALMKIKGLFYTLIGILFCSTLLTNCTSKTNPEEKTPEVMVPNKAKDLASATEAINSRCPLRVDSESRLDSVLFSMEGQLVYYYTLPNKVSSGINPPAFTAFLLPKIIENVRTNPDLKMHRDSLVTMVFNYLDGNGAFITEFMVGPDVYR